MENGRKIILWKIQEKSQLENDRMENAHHEKWQKSHTMENARKLNVGN